MARAGQCLEYGPSKQLAVAATINNMHVNKYLDYRVVLYRESSLVTPLLAVTAFQNDAGIITGSKPIYPRLGWPTRVCLSL